MKSDNCDKRSESLVGLKNQYENERIFLIGNGPSLNKKVLNDLSDEYTFATNKISKMYSKTTWRPSFYYYALRSNNTESANISDPNNYLYKNIFSDVKCFIRSEYQGIIEEQKNINYVDIFSLFGDTPVHNYSEEDLAGFPVNKLQEFWSDNISNLVYHYHSIYPMIQIAVYLGFDSIYFVGTDLGLSYQNPHMIFNSGLDPFRYNGTKLSFLKDSVESRSPFRSFGNYLSMKLISKLNHEMPSIVKFFGAQDVDDHFKSDYFQSLRIRDGKRVEREIRKSHVIAKRICEDKGISIKNLTPGGDLDIYPREDLNNII